MAWTQYWERHDTRNVVASVMRLGSAWVESNGDKPVETQSQRTRNTKGRTGLWNCVKFNATGSDLVVKSTKAGDTVRLMTAREFKEARNVKGQEAKKAYNEYLRTNGRASTAALAAALTSGELLVKGYRDGKNAVSVNFVKASSLKDPDADKGKTVDEMTEEELLAALEAKRAQKN